MLKHNPCESQRHLWPDTPCPVSQDSPGPAQGPGPNVSPLGCQSCLSHALTALPCLATGPSKGPRSFPIPIPIPREVPEMVLGCPHVPSLGAWDSSLLPGPPCRLPQLLARRGPWPLLYPDSIHKTFYLNHLSIKEHLDNGLGHMF